PTEVVWQGCNAGKRSFGILHNGDILGCTSIRDKEMIEGNIRHRSVVDIWQDTGTFRWARSMKKSDLKGFCGACAYAGTCLGGCPNTRLTINGSIYSENPWCAYHNAMTATRETLNAHENPKSLMAAARAFSERGQWQAAGLALERLEALSPNDVDSLMLYGFVSFMLGNYDQAARANKAVLSQDAENAYARKGLGLSLHRLGKSREGIVHLEKAVSLNSPFRADALHDLAVVYQELGQAGPF
ncbi:MAG: SPASM domain-containing protein, partial [Desulfatitalea sp.]|nr:SPASM domain-containing protein [Desulfatitalea sp.]NNK02452.1 SPASM domain-containing protein [Desulfatitalea sp.]